MIGVDLDFVDNTGTILTTCMYLTFQKRHSSLFLEELMLDRLLLHALKYGYQHLPLESLKLCSILCFAHSYHGPFYDSITSQFRAAAIISISIRYFLQWKVTVCDA